MLFSNQPWTEKSVNQSYCYLVYAAPLDNIQKRHFIHIVGSSSPIDVLLGSFTAGCSFYDNCIVHHIQFCPVNLLLISRRAFGSLDTNSGGTAVVSLEGVLTGRERRLPFILRWNVWEPSGQVLALSTDVTAKDSFGLLLRSFRGCRSVSFPLGFCFFLPTVLFSYFLGVNITQCGILRTFSPRLLWRLRVRDHMRMTGKIQLSLRCTPNTAEEPCWIRG